MPSFDIVSKADSQEIDNAINSCMREIANRYDFKGTNCSFELNKDDITILADNDHKLKAMHDIFKVNITRRNLDVKVFEFGKEEKASGNTLRQKIEIKQGIDADNARKIMKMIKAEKFKVTASNRGEKIRVESKKLDELQTVMAFLKKADLDIALAFENYL